jgi:hypothetical protein
MDSKRNKKIVREGDGRVLRFPALSESRIPVVKIVEAGAVVAKEKAFDHVRGPVAIVVVGSEVQLPEYLSFVSAMQVEQVHK